MIHSTRQTSEKQQTSRHSCTRTHSDRFSVGSQRRIECVYVYIYTLLQLITTVTKWLDTISFFAQLKLEYRINVCSQCGLIYTYDYLLRIAWNASVANWYQRDVHHDNGNEDDDDSSCLDCFRSHFFNCYCYRRCQLFFSLILSSWFAVKVCSRSFFFLNFAWDAVFVAILGNNLVTCIGCSSTLVRFTPIPAEKKMREFLEQINGEVHKEINDYVNFLIIRMRPSHTNLHTGKRTIARANIHIHSIMAAIIKSYYMNDDDKIEMRTCAVSA